MEQLIEYLVSTVVTILLIAIILLTRGGMTVLKNKSNLAFDEARNIKVEAITKLVGEQVEQAINAFFIENDIGEITSDNLDEVVKLIGDKVKVLVGDGVVQFLLNTFVDNWDDWIYETILARIGKQS